jgi:hypothetical protein
MFEMRWGNMHFGVDLACPDGTPFYSVHTGTVTIAGTTAATAPRSWSTTAPASW